MDHEEWNHLRKSNLEISFETDEWSSVDVLVKWIRRHLKARIAWRADGPDARTICLELSSHRRITIYQLDTGDVTLLGSFDAGREMQEIAKECNAKVIDPRMQRPQM